MVSIPVVDKALSLYSSSTIKARAEGATLLQDLFGSRETLEAFAEIASRDNGAGWVALFQVLFEAVSIEKQRVSSGNTKGYDNGKSHQSDYLLTLSQLLIVSIVPSPLFALSQRNQLSF